MPGSLEWRAARVHLTRTTPRATLRSVGTWRSLVARTLGVGEAAGSNPVVPTIHFQNFPSYSIFNRSGRFEAVQFFDTFASEGRQSPTRL